MGPYGGYIQFENSKFVKKLYQVEGKRNTRIKQVKIGELFLQRFFNNHWLKTHLIRKSIAMGISTDFHTSRLLPSLLRPSVFWKKQWKFQFLTSLNSIINSTFHLVLQNI